MPVKQMTVRHPWAMTVRFMRSQMPASRRLTRFSMSFLLLQLPIDGGTFIVPSIAEFVQRIAQFVIRQAQSGAMNSQPLKQTRELLESLNLAEVAKRTGLSLRTLYRIRDTEDVNITLDTFTRLQELARTLESSKRLPTGLLRRGIGKPPKKRRSRTPPG
jgi:hypothetical protein